MISAMPALSSAPRSVVPSEVVADQVVQHGMVGDPDDLVGIARQPDVAAPVVPDDLRLHVGAGKVGCRIHVGAEADHRHVVLVRVRGNRRIDIAVLVEMRVGDSDLEQLLDQQAAEILLLFGRRLAGGLGVGLGVDDDVTEEAVCNAEGHGGSKLRRATTDL
jgi:hypothetical protein